MHALSPAVASELEQGTNVLLLYPSFEAQRRAACVDLLTLDDPENKGVICVSFTESLPDRRVAWERYGDAVPARAAAIDVSGDPQPGGSTRRHLDEGAAASSFDPAVEVVRSPDDLTTLGVRIVACLNAWETAAPDLETTVCFDSLTTLLQYASLDRVREFLDVLTDRFRSAGAIAHYHMDPGAHDAETRQELTELFDVVCAYEDGECHCRAQ